MKAKLFSLFIAIIITNVAYCQEKYAVLITGCKPKWGVLDDQVSTPLHQFDEFWNDTYLMWELLTQKYGFNYENVNVLYFNGNDWNDPNQSNTNTRYKASLHNRPKITNYPADTNTIAQVLTNLKNQLTDKDFLFVWTFGHGSISSSGDHGLLRAYDPLNPASETMYMQDARLGYLINMISAKKVVWMAQCYGGNFYDDITAGENCYFLSAGSPGQTTHPAEDICPYNYKNERFPNTSNPVDTCYHGEFNFHVYSSSNGFAPNYSPYHGHPTSCPNIYSLFSNTDLNSDGFIDQYESYTWLSTFLATQETPQLVDPKNISPYTSFLWPTLLHNDLSQNITCHGKIGISNQTRVLTGQTLTFEEGAEVHLLSGSSLTIDNGANLVIKQNVHFIKDSPTSVPIEIKGSLSIGNNVHFDGNNSPNYLELIMNNAQNSYSISNCTFSNCIFKGNNGIISIDHSTFNKSYCTFGSIIPSDNLINVRFCNFEGNGIQFPAINLNNVNKMVIASNNINNYLNGCTLNNSGFTTTPFYYLERNTITNCNYGSLQNNGRGIRLIGSRAIIRYNKILSNYIGLECLNNSTAYVYGYCPAPTINETQQISYNLNVEVQSTGNFPISFKHNAVADNNTEVRIKCIGCPVNQVYNLEKNYWVSNPPPSTLFSPSSNFDRDPTWTPGICTGTGVDPNPSSKVADSLYQVGLDLLEVEDFVSAKNEFNEIIQEYSGTAFAQSSLNELFYVEKALGENYNELKEFYTNDSLANNDSVMMKTASALANQCDIKLKNYDEAISWFENVIENPPSTNDSIFAIIDLGNTYLLAETDSLKNCPVGRFQEYKPKSIPEYFTYRDYLLGLVNNENTTHKGFNTIVKPAKINSLNPNPAHQSVNVIFELTDENTISFMIRNMVGQIDQSQNEEHYLKGIHSKTINTNKLAAGTYTLTILVNGISYDSQKLIIY